MYFVHGDYLPFVIKDESEDVIEPPLIVYKDDVSLGSFKENNSSSHPGDAVDTVDVLERNGWFRLHIFNVLLFGVYLLVWHGLIVLRLHFKFRNQS